MPSENFLTVNQLSRYYSGVCAVDSISFEVKKGEVLGFLGPNGAGKSTTMQMLTGVLAPTDGEIWVKGVDLLTQPAEAKAHIGYLPEQPPLYTDFCVDEYLQFCARLHRIDPSDTSRAVNDSKARCGLGDVGHRLIKNLSKGYQQRVGIAQAIIHRPDIVILDEPTVGLDPIQIREIRQLIKELGGEHSVILSSHILPEIQATCDRVQIINKGRLIFSDTVANLHQHMQVSSLIVGLRRPPDKEHLATLDGISRVEQLDPHSFRLHYNPEHDPAEQLAKTCVAKDWGLFQLTPDHRSLEEIFVDITTTESPVADTAPEKVVEATTEVKPS